MRMPGLIPATSKIEANVVNADIAPTLLELAGVAKPADMQGKSFAVVLPKTDKKHREDVFYHYFENGEHAVSPHFGVKSGRYKLILFYKRVEAWELFDLETDPQELKNLVADPSYQSILKKMKKKLLKQIKAFDDAQAEEIFHQKLK